MGLFGWSYRVRRSPRWKWLKFNLTQRGMSSITINPDNRDGKRDWWERLSYNTRTHRASVDTPGPGGWHKRVGKPRRRRSRR